MARQQQITNKTLHYVNAITTLSLHKLPVIQFGNTISHRLFRKAKVHNSVSKSAPLQCTQTYDFNPLSLNIQLRSILIISSHLQQVFQAYKKYNHRSSTAPSNSLTLPRIFKGKCLSKQRTASPPQFIKSFEC